MAQKRNQCRNLNLFRNTSKGFGLCFKKNDCPVDITGWTIFFTMKKAMQDTDNDAIIKKDIITHEDPKNGKTVIEILANETEDLKGSYYYDIKFKDTDANSDILFFGQILIKEPVTTRG